MSETIKSKFIPLLLILIIIAVAGWYVGAKTLSFKNQNSTSPNQNANSAEQKWKTYTNEKYKYKFTYPSDLVLTDGKYDQDNVLFKDIGGLTPDVIQISVSSAKKRGIFTAEEWINNYEQEGYFKERDIIIDQIPAIVFGLKIGNDVVIDSKGIIFFKGDNLFTVNFHATDAPKLSNDNLVQYFLTHFKSEN